MGTAREAIKRALQQHSWTLVSHLSLKSWRSKWKNPQVSTRNSTIYGICNGIYSHPPLICFFKLYLVMTSKAARCPLGEHWEIIFSFPCEWRGAPFPDKQSQQHGPQQQQKHKGSKGAASPQRCASLSWSEHWLQSAYQRSPQHALLKADGEHQFSRVFNTTPLWSPDFVQAKTKWWFFSHLYQSSWLERSISCINQHPCTEVKPGKCCSLLLSHEPCLILLCYCLIYEQLNFYQVGSTNQLMLLWFWHFKKILLHNQSRNKNTQAAERLELNKKCYKTGTDLGIMRSPHTSTHKKLFCSLK